MTPELQAQLELLKQKTEPFVSRSNAVGEAITTIRDTLLLITRTTEAEAVAVEVEALPTSPETPPENTEATAETETKKSRKAS